MTLVLVALTWWGKASMNSADWVKAVTEVGAVLQFMIEDADAGWAVPQQKQVESIGSKRTAEEGGDGNKRVPIKRVRMW